MLLDMACLGKHYQTQPFHTEAVAAYKKANTRYLVFMGVFSLISAGAIADSIFCG